MRSLRRSDRGLSEIVGTLMLILIVVSAATLLAAFVASYQAQLQKEESYSHDQSLESIHILAMNTSLNLAGTQFATLAFTIGSESVNPSTIVGLSINNNALKTIYWKDLDNGTKGSGTPAPYLNITSLEEVMIWLNLNSSQSGFSFFEPSAAPTVNQYIEINIYTVLQNDFSRTFLPPVALGAVSEVNPSGEPGDASVLLDGSTSFQPEGNSTIIEWNWTVFNDTSGMYLNNSPLYGEEAQFSASDFIGGGDQYLVNLTVTNSDGLIGATSIDWRAPLG